jgi:universal stress protein E
MRRCPCPVWVTRPGHGARPLRTLVATDLHPASENALVVGLALGAAALEPIHILHVVEYPLDQVWSTGLEDAKSREYHRKVREAAEQELGDQVSRLAHREKLPAIAVHLVDGNGLPDLAIQHFIHQHQIDLLIMGSIARAGLLGILIGNTAERLLPEVECSVITVKPPGFHSPVNVE